MHSDTYYRLAKKVNNATTVKELNNLKEQAKLRLPTKEERDLICGRAEQMERFIDLLKIIEFEGSDNAKREVSKIRKVYL